MLPVTVPVAHSYIRFIIEPTATARVIIKLYSEILQYNNYSVFHTIKQYLTSKNKGKFYDRQSPQSIIIPVLEFNFALYK